MTAAVVSLAVVCVALTIALLLVVRQILARPSSDAFTRELLTAVIARNATEVAQVNTSRARVAMAEADPVKAAEQLIRAAATPAPQPSGLDGR